MSWLPRTFITCLAGLVLTAPTLADEKDWYKEARKRQREHEKRLREFQKKQHEWAREEQKRADEYARETWKREREFQRDQYRGYEGPYSGDPQYGGYSEPYYSGPAQPFHQTPGLPGSYSIPGSYAPPTYSQPYFAPSAARPLGLNGSVVLPSGRAFGFSGQFQIVPLNVWP